LQQKGGNISMAKTVTKAEKKLYLGKFETVENLEEAYGGLEKKIREQEEGMNAFAEKIVVHIYSITKALHKINSILLNELDGTIH
jgi:hypothetical protein